MTGLWEYCDSSLRRLHDSPWSISQEILDRAQRFEAVLPGGSISEIREDQRTLTNVIHINEIVPMIQCLLLRNAMHFDNFQTWMMAHNIFDTNSYSPRIVCAMYESDETRHRGGDHRRSSDSATVADDDSSMTSGVSSARRSKTGKSHSAKESSVFASVFGVFSSSTTKNADHHIVVKVKRIRVIA